MNYTVKMMQEAAEYIKSQISIQPEVGLILGSGLGVLGDDVENAVRIPYQDIPHFPLSTVVGHAGQLVIGTLKGRPVLVMQGRFHFYEGYSMQVIGFPVRVMKLLGIEIQVIKFIGGAIMILLGIESMIVTNAAGGCNPKFNPGDLMIITDHIKFFDESPLRGPNIDEFGPRFNDMSEPYTKKLGDLAIRVAKKLGFSLRKGVYAHMAGPSFETPAEIRMLQVLGADAVGMSTVPEVITAIHSGMKVLGISCITNMAAGILDQPLNHEEVLETGAMVRDTFASLIKGVLAEWDDIVVYSMNHERKKEESP